MHTQKNGFTLVELLTAIAIIGILAGVTLPSLMGSRQRARDSERETEVGQIVLALELYYNACREYPDHAGGLQLSDNNGCPSGVTFGTYLNDIPTDPTGGDYTYVTGSSHSEFLVKTTLEQVSTALESDLDGTVLGEDCNDAGLFYCKGG